MQCPANISFAFARSASLQARFPAGMALVRGGAVVVGRGHCRRLLNDGGGFQYDFAVPAQFAGLSAHNYFWNNLQVGAKQSITVGFDDVHGPTNATWGIQRGGAVNHIELTQLVPGPVPEPSQLAMLVAGMGLMGAVAVRRRRR